MPSFYNKSLVLVVFSALIIFKPILAGTLDLHLRHLVNVIEQDAKITYRGNNKRSLSTTTKQRLERTGLVLFQHDQNASRSTNPERHLDEEAVNDSVVTMVSVFMEIHDLSVLYSIRQKGTIIRTVTSSGVATADVPVHELRSVANRKEIGRMEASKAAQLSNDKSNALRVRIDEDYRDVYSGMNNSRDFSGQGVIVGIFDTGIDWTHEDFIDESNNTRILYYWDHSSSNIKLLKGMDYSYGREYNSTEINRALHSYDNSWDPETNSFAPNSLQSYPIDRTARDVDGHGTHVTGTAAGNGRGSGFKGVAYEASIIAVKWDLCGDRNSETNIIDGVNYIFKRAEELGMPAVVNLSLGSSLGPHDGSTLADRAMNDLVGPGKVVVAAAGNSGKSHHFFEDFTGYPQHGQGKIDEDIITIRIPDLTDMPAESTYCGGTGGYYFMFDIWYSGLDSCQVQITTPKGDAFYMKEWATDRGGAEINTDEGHIYITNGKGNSEDDEGSNEIFIFIADIDGQPMASGTWQFELIGINVKSDGIYNAWYETSSGILAGWNSEELPRDPTPKFGANIADNKMTVGSPASVDRVIAVGAYTTRLMWPYYNKRTGTTGSREKGYKDQPLSADYNDFKVGDLAYFSSRGPRRDGVLKPDICAPGVGIASSLSHFVRVDEWSYGSFFSRNIVLPNLEAVVFEGTSMASPNIAGAVALLLQVDPTLDDRDLRKIFSKTAIRDKITTTYESFNANMSVEDHVDSDMSTGSQPFNNDWGFGKMDINAALASNFSKCHDFDCNDDDLCTQDMCNYDVECGHTRITPCVSLPKEGQEENNGLPLGPRSNGISLNHAQTTPMTIVVYLLYEYFL